MKWRAGAGQTGAPILKYRGGAPVSAQACGRHAPPFAQAPGWRGVLSLRRRPALRAFPLSQRRAGTQRAKGKARSAAEVRGAASGRKRPGADFRRGSGARRNRRLGPSLRSLPFLSLSPPFPVLTASRDASGTQGAGAGRAGRMRILHLPCCSEMARLRASPSLWGPAHLPGGLWLPFLP